MGTPNKQIGWSQEATLLQIMSKQLDALNGLIGSIGSTPLDTAPIELNNTNKTAWNNGPGNIDTNTSFGMNAFISNTTGAENTAFGYNALRSNITAPYNVAIGAYALYSSNGQQNTAVGAHAQEFGVDTFNVSVGAYSLIKVASLQNSALGTLAGAGITGGQRNTVVGYNAMGGVNGQNITGSLNMVLGYQAGGALTTGGQNILIENIISGTSGVTTGSNNIIINGIGFSGITTGNNNTIIGGFNGTIANLSDQVIIGTGNGVRRIAFDPTGQMTISNTQPVGTAAATEKLLVRDTAAGAIKTLDYVAVNATATALSAATLNSTYATARTGFRVICMSIGAGALIYTKTSTGWSSSAVVNVV